MSTHLGQLPPPESAKDFELLCLDVLSAVYADPGAQQYGRPGQKQHGVDLLAHYSGAAVAVQCKQKDLLADSTGDSKRLRGELKRELIEETEKAKSFKTNLERFIFATSASTDAEVQNEAERLSAKHRREGIFAVEVWFWEKILHEISSRPDLLNRILGSYYPRLLEALRDYFEDPTHLDYSMVCRAAGRYFEHLVRSARPYLEYLATQCQDLPLRGMASGAGDPRLKGEISLDAVYVGLDTKSPRLAPDPGPAGLEQSAGFVKSGGQSVDEPRNLSALEVVAQNARLVLLGDPGSGKSTFINYLCLCLANHHAHPEQGWLDRLPHWPGSLGALIPISITLRFFVRDLVENFRLQVAARLSDADRIAAAALGLEEFVKKYHRDLPRPSARLLWDFFLKTVEGNTPEHCAAALQSALNHPAGHAIVFLDGLDEVPTDAIRELVRDTVLDFMRWHPHARLAITCRVMSYQQRQWRLLNLPEATLAPFRDDQVGTFISRWYQAHVTAGFPSEEARRRQDDLEQALPGRPELSELARNPMMLTVMALLHTYRGKLPEHRALLYRDVVELLLHRWEEVKQRDNMVGMNQLLRQVRKDDNDLQRALWRVAFEAHHEGRHASSDAASDISRHALHEALRVLADGSYDWADKAVQTMQERAGLLVAKSTHVFHFPHRSFQEFLAAAHLADDPNYQGTAVGLVDDSGYWREVIKWSAGWVTHCLNRPREAIALLNELCPDEQPPATYPWHRIWLAGEILSEMGREKASQTDAGKVLVGRVPRLLRKLIERADALTSVQRVQVGLTLGRLGDDREGLATRPRPGQKDRPDFLWTSVIQPDNFIMGGEREYEGNLQFTHRVGHPFRVALYPVTVAQYDLFVHDDGYSREELWTKAGWQWREKEKRTRPDDYASVFQTPNHPRVGVTWYEAMAFCKWLNVEFKATELKLSEGWEVRLPTEAEWERAARHTDGRDFPWKSGSEAEPAKHCNCNETGIGHTSAVGLFQSGKAECGAFDLAGNVWEWTRSLWGKDWQKPGFGYPYDPADGRENLEAPADVIRVLRGGSWGGNAVNARCACRGRRNPVVRGRYIGFRLVASPFVSEL